MLTHEYRIALIDGDGAIRAGRRLLLDSQQDMKVVYEQSQASLALEQIPNLLVDVLIIDHRLQGIDGVALAKKIVEAFTQAGERVPAVIITGSYYSFELLMASIRAGATELVTQDSPSSELLDAIRKTSRTMAEVKLQSFKQFLDSHQYTPVADVSYLLKLSLLDDEQREILEALGQALDLDQIAMQLGLAKSRVRDSIDELLRIFGCATIEQFYLTVRDSQRIG